jgi:hypothetical protein
MPIVNILIEREEPTINAEISTSPENPGIKNPTVIAAKRILPRSMISFESLSIFVGESIIG